MRLANASRLLAAALFLLAGFAGTSMAQETEEGIYAGHIYVDFGTGLRYTPKGGYVTQLAGDVYNNTNPTPPVVGGVSSTDLNARWGDRVTTTGTGILQENDFTIFNSGSSAGPLLTAVVNIALFDAVTSGLLGSYNVNANFGPGGLPAGFFTILTVTGLGGLSINVPVTDVIMLQQVGARTGTASRLGVAALNPPSIGSSANTMYINATTIGPAGFYTPFAAGSSPAVAINLNALVPAPAATSWGAIKANYPQLGGLFAAAANPAAFAGRGGFSFKQEATMAGPGIVRIRVPPFLFDRQRGETLGDHLSGNLPRDRFLSSAVQCTQSARYATFTTTVTSSVWWRP
jgi:hypothetical protein